MSGFRRRPVAMLLVAATAMGALLFVPSGPAHALVELASAEASTLTGSRHLTHTTLFDVPETSGNPLLIVAVHYRSESPTDRATISAVTLDGAPLSPAIGSVTSGGDSVALFHRVNPSPGSGRVVEVTFTPGAGDQQVLESVLTMSVYTGVDQGSPVAAKTTATGDDDSPTVTITPHASRSVVLASVVQGQAAYDRTSSGTATFQRYAVSASRQEPAADPTASILALGGERSQTSGLPVSLSWAPIETAPWAAAAVELRSAPTSLAAEFTSDCSSDAAGPLVDGSLSTRRVQGNWGGLSTTFSHTTSTLANLLLVVAHVEDQGAATAITSITSGGAALTRAVSETASALTTEIWYLADPPAGTATINVTVDESTAAEAVFKAVAFRRTDAASPVGAMLGANGTGTRPEITLTTQRASSTILTGFTHATETFPPLTASGVSQRLYTAGAQGDNLDPSTTSLAAGAAYVDATVPRPFEIGWSGTESGAWTAVAVELKGSATANNLDPPLTTAVGLPTGFIHAGDGTDVTDFAWDFDGDGVVDSTERHPTHIYTRDGVYDVTLTVTTPSGSTASMTRQMVVRADGIQSFNRRYKVYATDPAANDGFGTSVAIDGNRLLVGSPYNVHNGVSSGTAYFYEWDGTSWVMVQMLQPASLADNDWFGYAVGLSGDRAIIGAPGTDSPSNAGSAFVYQHDGSSWVLERELRSADRASNDAFGQGVGIDGTYILVGASADDDNGLGNSGSVYPYAYDGTSWVAQSKIYAPDKASGDLFGRGLAVHGARAMIGATEDDDVANASGSVYVFERTGPTWTFKSKITAPDPKTNDRFGQGIGLHGDVAVISASHDDTAAPNAGSVYVYEYNGTSWVHQPPELFADDASNDANLGFGLGLWGGRIAAGSPKDDDNSLSNSGSVYVMGCGFDDLRYEVSGRIFEDVAGDLLPPGQNVGDAANPLRDATLTLYVDGGDGIPDGVDDSLVTSPKQTLANESWWVVPDGTYWLVADSKTVTPSAGFNPGFGPGDVWAEQTYGPAGSVTYDGGSYSYRATAGSMIGGQRPLRSDDASSLSTAEHVARATVAGASVKRLDFGFSFQVITRTGDGDDDAASSRTVQGSLRQFIQNSNAIAGTQTSQFLLPTTDPNYNVEGKNEFTFAPLSPLPGITDSIVLDGSTQQGFAAQPLIQIDGTSAGAGADGLVLEAGSGGSTIAHLTVNRFGSDGIVVRSDDNLIQGNHIGTDVTGAAARGNAGSGILLEDGASGNLIGGVEDGSGNVIARNGSDGITLSADAGTGNSFLGNSIFGNTGLGIDLGDDGPDANDAGDGDSGVNDRMNAPTIIDVDDTVDGAVVTLSLDLPAGTYRIEYFLNDTVDGSGRGEGKYFVSYQTITHDGSGPLTFTSSAFAANPSIISATVTQVNEDGTTASTSEFSNSWKILHAASPVEVILFSSASAVEISSAEDHTCGRVSDGTLRCWGSGDSGRLGTAGVADALVADTVRNIGDVIDLGTSNAGAHTCAVASDGAAWCWGEGADGRLGNGATADSSVPVKVADVTGFRAVTTGGSHSCGLRSNGTVWCWGSDANGQLGDGGSNAGSSVPVQVSGLSGAVEVHAGDAFTCARLAGGGIRCWGSDARGQLGDGAGTLDAGAPVTVVGVGGTRALSVGAAHACAATASGSGWCWGANSDGQLGDGTTTDRGSAVEVSGAGTLVRFGAGKHHTCVVDGDGALACAGDNDNGQLGSGGTTPASTFTPVNGPAGVKDAESGGGHTCLVDGGGRPWCWGRGSSGQIGDGKRLDRPVPARIRIL